MERIYVYKIVNNLNGKYYIGVHKHKSTRKDYYMGSGIAINKAYTKYGKENFTKEILKEFETYKEALNYEKELVTEVEVKNTMCYNLRCGGGHLYIKTTSIETKRKLKEAAKHRPKISKATREKHRTANIGSCNNMFGLKGEKNPNFGSRRSKQQCENISKSQIGKTVSNETKRKIAEANKRRWLLYRINLIMKRRKEVI